jgi:hypothetical protein
MAGWDRYQQALGGGFVRAWNKCMQRLIRQPVSAE